MIGVCLFGVVRMVFACFAVLMVFLLFFLLLLLLLLIPRRRRRRCCCCCLFVLLSLINVSKGGLVRCWMISILIRFGVHTCLIA